MDSALSDSSDDPPEPLNPDTVSTDSGIASCPDDEVSFSPSSSLSAAAKVSPRFSPPENKENLVRRISQTIEKAVRQKKVFCTGGHFPGARKALKKRGWVEINCHNGRGPGGCVKAVTWSGGSQGFGAVSEAFECNLKSLKENYDSTHKMILSGNYKKIKNLPEHITYRLLKNFIPNYQWCVQRRRILWKSLKRDQQVNKFPHAYFTTKIGLHRCLQNLHWFSSHPVSSFFPRCYEVSSDEERKAFIDDYRITACFCLIRWFYESFCKKGSEGVEEQSGKARRSSMEFALQNCREYINKKNHNDLDTLDSTVWEHQWSQFLTDFYLICHDHYKLQPHFPEIGLSNEELFKECDFAVKQLRDYSHQFEMDGTFNIWIIKPGCSSRGRGISLAKRLEGILETVGSSGTNKSRFIVQKYIERPLLIYRTKFDIRQWLLVTSWNPLHIWMYKHSYLRFCSQPYNLQSHHESIHLCNNAIQSKYTINSDRSVQLPTENMWDSYTFHTFLKSQGHGDKWGSVIFPAMRKALIGTLLATQDNMDMSSKNNSFELYGADFMLTEDFNPWLIEINSSPALGSTTAVTARLCSEVLEDVVKVTVDRKRNKNCDPGNFELVYKQNSLQNPFFVGANLSVKGVKIDISLIAPGGRKYAFNESLIDRIKNPKTNIRISPPKEEVQGLLAEAQRSVSAMTNLSNRKPIITDLIDNIMSIPSCFQDTKSKISMVKEWMDHHHRQEDERNKKDLGTSSLNKNEQKQERKFPYSASPRNKGIGFLRKSTSKICPLSINDEEEGEPANDENFVAPVPKKSRNERNKSGKSRRGSSGNKRKLSGKKSGSKPNLKQFSISKTVASLTRTKRDKMKNKFIKFHKISPTSSSSSNGKKKGPKRLNVAPVEERKEFEDPTKWILQKIPVCDNQRILQKYGCSHFPSL